MSGIKMLEIAFSIDRTCSAAAGVFVAAAGVFAAIKREAFDERLVLYNDQQK